MGSQGTTTVNFGAFPGASDTSVAVTGQGGITSGNLVEAWILPAATADHTADEHWVEDFKVVAGNIVPGTGFTIYARNTNNLFSAPPSFNTQGDTLGYTGPDVGGRGTLIYGAWNIAWVWN
jgi:hypothetical protein